MRQIILGGHDAVTRAARPDHPYGSSPWLRVGNQDSRAFIRMGLSPLPNRVFINQSLLEVTLRRDCNNTDPLVLRKIFDGWEPDEITWNHEPTLGADPVDTKLLTGKAGSSARFDVTQNTIGAYAGTTKNRGWRLSTNSATPYYLGGIDSGDYRPRLIVDYDHATSRPDITAPANGVIGLAKPAVVFDAMEDATHLKVQVSTSKNFASVLWESVWIPITDAQIVNLANTGFPGFVEGTTYWVRGDAKNARGNGGWGDPVWVKFLHNLNPYYINPAGGIVDDGSPPLVWGLGPGEVQERYRAKILDADKDVLWDSRERVTAVQAATPTKGLTRLGQDGFLELAVRDKEDRVPSPGDPAWVTIRRAITLAGTDTLAPMGGLEVDQTGYGEPWIRVTASRGSIPDYVSLQRDGDEVKRLLGGALFDPATKTYSVVDYTAAPQLRHGYALVPIVNGKRPADPGQEHFITPDIKGVWMCDPDTGQDVLFTGRDDPSVEPYVDSETLWPLGAEYAMVRTFTIGGGTITVTGLLKGGYLDRDPEADDKLLQSWWRRSTRRGLVLRLAWASRNVPVTITNVVSAPVRAHSRPDSPAYGVTVTCVVAQDPDDRDEDLSL